MLRIAAWSSPRSGRRAATPWVRVAILGMSLLALAIAWAALRAPPLAQAGGLGAGIAFWSWIFGASGCARVLALAAEGRLAGMPVARMLCAMVGLVSWSELAWLLIESVATSAVAAAGGLGFFVLVAVTELHAIYRAACDARTDDP